MAGDQFENIVRMLLEADGYWIAQSFKVELTKAEKRQTGKHSIPRPEIDMLAMHFGRNEILAIETKSYLDSPGVKAAELTATSETPQGRYKMFTCPNYRGIVMKRLKEDLQRRGMANAQTSFRLGLVIGNVYRGDLLRVRRHAQAEGWFYWSPRLLRRKLTAQAKRAYENDSAIIAAKILVRK